MSQAAATVAPALANGDDETRIEDRAAFDLIRYAQVWEDADVLLDGLDPRPGETCLSIASAGDNALALLTADPAHVVAVDLSRPQLACLDLRQACYRELAHDEFLELYGARGGETAPVRREKHLRRALKALREDDHRAFWDTKRDEVIAKGYGAIGKFERYFRLFRRYVLPLAHSRRTVDRLLDPETARDGEARARFYALRWNRLRWRMLFRVFFSRPVMGMLGRDPAFFDHVEGGPVAHLIARTRHALVDLDPAQNPHLHWILTGRFGEALPLALRAEHYETIRERLDRLEWRVGPIDAVAGALKAEGRPAARFNLSDVFEYMDEATTAAILERLADASAPGGRVLYWNMAAPRSRPDALAHKLTPRPDLATRLHAQDKAFFYSAVVVEDVV